MEPAEKLEKVVYDKPETRDRGDAACSKSIINYKYANGVVLTLSAIDPKIGGGATFIGDKARSRFFAADTSVIRKVSTRPRFLPTRSAPTRATTTCRISLTALPPGKTPS